MELREDLVGEVTLLAVAGRIDSSTAGTLDGRLANFQAALRNRLVLDLGQVDYISSAGFRVLMITARRIQDANGRLALCGLSAELHRLFEIAALTEFFTIVASRNEALTSTANVRD